DDVGIKPANLRIAVPLLPPPLTRPERHPLSRASSDSPPCWLLCANKSKLWDMDIPFRLASKHQMPAVLAEQRTTILKFSRRPRVLQKHGSKPDAFCSTQPARLRWPPRLASPPRAGVLLVTSRHCQDLSPTAHASTHAPSGSSPGPSPLWTLHFRPSLPNAPSL
ncbi:hypothetical protein CORC01_00982, partial [Colletotrichum orchidophilum]